MSSKNDERVEVHQEKRIYAYSLGLLFYRRARKILEAHGYSIHFGLPKKDDAVAVWGRKKASMRGRRIAQQRGVPLFTVEDSFLRSVKTGRQGEPSLGVVLDRKGIFFDAQSKNELDDHIQASESLNSHSLEQCTIAIDAMRARDLSKYNASKAADYDLGWDYVLVVDQTQGDASISLGGADSSTFETTLKAAMEENPNSRILLKTHPETVAGKRRGHYVSNTKSENNRLVIYDKPVSTWTLLARAKSVYCVTSQVGMEAIFAGHKPIVFGQAFYSGWGLTEDRHPNQKVKGSRSAEQLFWAAYQKYTLWYDPFFKRKSNFYRTLDILEEKVKNWRDSQSGVVFYGMRLWKRGFLKTYLPYANKKISFQNSPTRAIARAQKKQATIFRWGLKGGEEFREKVDDAGVSVVSVEDGFLRSKGLGATLVRPVSLVFDDQGLYYDPNHKSGLEVLIHKSLALPEREILRARNLRARLLHGGFSKYNLEGYLPRIAPRKHQKIILVVGQVEDDASIQLGADKVKTNKDLLMAARRQYPTDYVIYKPHPDVEAGLRNGSVTQETLHATSDVVAAEANISKLIAKCDVLCTITSLSGFEALMQGKTVMCFGRPFYAGWGLTIDMGDEIPRRRAKPSLDQLTHAVMIGYPRYWDPLTKQACPVEVVLERFEKGEFGQRAQFGNKALAKLQGVFASYASIWR